MDGSGYHRDGDGRALPGVLKQRPTEPCSRPTTPCRVPGRGVIDGGERVSAERRRRPVLGFAPHSGWAAVVVVGGVIDEPEVLARQCVGMADPDLPGSKQPYHEVEELALQEAGRRRL